MNLSIDRLIKLIPEWKGKLIKVNPINSGITNINFKVNVDKRVFFLSMLGSNSELLNIDYRNKYYNNKICGMSRYPNLNNSYPLKTSIFIPFLSPNICYHGVVQG